MRLANRSEVGILIFEADHWLERSASPLVQRNAKLAKRIIMEYLANQKGLTISKEAVKVISFPKRRR